MSKKTTFGEQDDTPKDGDGDAAQSDATVREDTKTASRRKSTRKATTQPPTPAKQVATLDAMAATVESEVAHRGSPSAHSEASGIGGISDTESGEDEDLTLHSHRSEGDKRTTGAEGSKGSAVRRDREGSVASSVDTFRSMSLGEGSNIKKKAASQPPGTLRETHPQFFPPPRPIIRTLDTEQLDAIDATRTTAKEAAKRRRPTMEEIKRLEKERGERTDHALYPKNAQRSAS